MSKLQYFGTDGIRGEYGQFPIVPEFIAQLGWAAGKVLAQDGQGHVVVGHDGRASNVALRAALLSGLHSAGVNVIDMDLCPTPAIAYLTQHFNAKAGIVISASHNPAKDNGIKFFNHNGGKLTPDQEQQIEASINDAPATLAPLQVCPTPAFRQAYHQFCLDSVAGVDLTGTRIVVDCANGAMSEVAPAIFTQLGAEVEAIFCQPDGANINANCGATAIAACQQQVRSRQAHLGIAFDGDGDRVLMVDGQGDVISGDGILYLLAQSPTRGSAGVVGTVMSNMGLEAVLQAKQIPFTRTKVGDAHVLAECHARGWQLGGEPSGHIICLQQTTTGDGLIAALQVLAHCLAGENKNIRQQLSGYVPYPQTLVNVAVAKPSLVMQHPDVVAAIEAQTAQLADRGRILVRPSGTEPVVRVLVEGKDPILNQQVADEIAKIIVASVQ